VGKGAEENLKKKKIGRGRGGGGGGVGSCEKIKQYGKRREVPTLEVEKRKRVERGKEEKKKAGGWSCLSSVLKGLG